MDKRFQGGLALLLCTVIWGMAFVAQSVGMDHVGAFTFQAARCILAIVTLVALIWAFDRSNFISGWKNRKLWSTGLLCGIALFLATSLQQIGLIYTDAGKAGFLTAMYIVLVPVIGILLKKKPPRTALISILPAVIGLYLLSCAGMDRIDVGDICLIGCALCFSIQITLIDRLAGELDSLRLNCVQCIVCAVGSLLFAVTEPVTVESLRACWGSIVYAGALSLGIAYSLQIFGQKRLEPTAASLIMSLESVFAALGGWLFLQERMSILELMGCVLMFGAVILSQLPEQLILERSPSDLGNSDRNRGS